MKISVIIPTVNEAENIAACIRRARLCPSAQIIVADGGSVDQTISNARLCGAEIFPCRRGRGAQMNCGAEAAAGEYLLFLHADTLLPDGYEMEVERVLSKQDTVAGAFHFSVDDRRMFFRILEKAVTVRSTWFGLPWGDQAIFTTRRAFNGAGGFSEQPLMEDVDFILKMKRTGRIGLASSSVLTSARRWQKLGVARTMFLNQLFLISYFAGVPPERLAEIYYRMPKSVHAKWSTFINNNQGR